MTKFSWKSEIVSHFKPLSEFDGLLSNFQTIYFQLQLRNLYVKLVDN